MTRLALTLLAAAAAPAFAGNSIVQTLNFDWNVNNGLQIGTLNAFDDAGGTRILTGVSFELDASATWDVTALNYSDVGFAADEWFAEGITNFNVLFGDIGPDSVERISGVVSFGNLTGILGAGSGSPFGPPGDPTVSDSFTSDIGSAQSLNSAEFQAFTSGPISTNLLAFTDIQIDGPNGAPGIISVNTDLLTSTGSLTLIYQYTDVPAPMTLALLPALGAVATRRRR